MSLYPFPLPRQTLTADMLDYLLGITPADNIRHYDVNINWQSSMNGVAMQLFYKLVRQSRQYSSAWGLPYTVLDPLVDSMTSTLIHATEKAVQKGEDPDPVSMDNLRIETVYAEKIKSLVLEITCSQTGGEESGPAGRMFNLEKCGWYCENPLGQSLLIGRLMEFQALEWQYHSIGETKLKAYKRLLRSLIQVIANQVFTHEQHQSYRRISKEGLKTETDQQYLINCQKRLLDLLAHDAFDVRRFALTSPWSKIGCNPWEEVEGSALSSARLRYYPRPAGIQPNHKTLYVSSPMINRCEIFDLAPEKSVISGMLALGYDLYMVDYGNPGAEQSGNGLDYYGKIVQDAYLDIIKHRHPGQTIHVLAYCMGGTLILPYLARRAEEMAAEGLPLDVEKLVLMSTPILFDDEGSGNKPMRDFLRGNYNNEIMKTFFGGCNVPPQTIEIGMNYIQPGVPFTVYEGFFERASFPGTIIDAAPFLFWLNSGTRFPAKAHQQWVKNFMKNEIWEGRYCLPSRRPELDGKPVNMDALNMDIPGGQRMALFDYRGLRDPIAPPTACISSERWGRLEDNIQMTRGGLNRTIEKNIGHIFVVSKTLLSEFLSEVTSFYAD